MIADQLSFDTIDRSYFPATVDGDVGQSNLNFVVVVVFVVGNIDGIGRGGRRIKANPFL